MADYPYNGPWQRTIRPAILERDRYICQVRLEGCTVKATHVDHIIPWRQGGAAWDHANLRAACESCNLKRVHRSPATGTPPPSRRW